MAISPLSYMQKLHSHNHIHTCDILPPPTPLTAQASPSTSRGRCVTADREAPSSSHQNPSTAPCSWANKASDGVLLVSSARHATAPITVLRGYGSSSSSSQAPYLMSCPLPSSAPSLAAWRCMPGIIGWRSWMPVPSPCLCLWQCLGIWRHACHTCHPCATQRCGQYFFRPRVARHDPSLQFDSPRLHLPVRRCWHWVPYRPQWALSPLCSPAWWGRPSFSPISRRLHARHSQCSRCEER